MIKLSSLNKFFRLFFICTICHGRHVSAFYSFIRFIARRQLLQYLARHTNYTFEKWKCVCFRRGWHFSFQKLSWLAVIMDNHNQSLGRSHNCFKRRGLIRQFLIVDSSCRNILSFGQSGSIEFSTYYRLLSKKQQTRALQWWKRCVMPIFLLTTSSSRTILEYCDRCRFFIEQESTSKTTVFTICTLGRHLALLICTCSDIFSVSMTWPFFCNLRNILFR